MGELTGRTQTLVWLPQQASLNSDPNKRRLTDL
jgi:hypothetical protein